MLVLCSKVAVKSIILLKFSRCLTHIIGEYLQDIDNQILISLTLRFPIFLWNANISVYWYIVTTYVLELKNSRQELLTKIVLFMLHVHFFILMASINIVLLQVINIRSLCRKSQCYCLIIPNNLQTWYWWAAYCSEELCYKVVWMSVQK